MPTNKKTIRKRKHTCKQSRTHKRKRKRERKRKRTRIIRINMSVMRILSGWKRVRSKRQIICKLKRKYKHKHKRSRKRESKRQHKCKHKRDENPIVNPKWEKDATKRKISCRSALTK